MTIKVARERADFPGWAKDMNRLAGTNPAAALLRLIIARLVRLNDRLLRVEGAHISEDDAKELKRRITAAQLNDDAMKDNLVAMAMRIEKLAERLEMFEARQASQERSMTELRRRVRDLDGAQ